MKDKNDFILEGLSMASDILEKTDELADIICKITDEHQQQIDEFAPQLLAKRIAEKRAKQKGRV